MRAYRLAALSLLLATAGTGLARAEDLASDVGTLTIRTVDQDSGKPVRAHILFRTSDDATPKPMADTDGLYESASYDCKPGSHLAFLAESVLVFYVGSETWQDCRHDAIVFAFARADVADDFERILAGNFDGLPPGIASLGTALNVAIQSGDNARTAAAASELAPRLRRADRGDLAKSASTVALYALGKSLSVEKPVTFDRPQKRFVLSAESVEALEEFQKTNGLPASGQADWRTLNGLSAGYSAELVHGMER